MSETRTNFPPTGTVSHGTMLNRDLIPAFGAVLHDYDYETWRNLFCNTYVGEVLKVIGTDSGFEENEATDDFVHDLFDALDFIAPPDHYFGAIEGDGSDYGFWPIPPDESEADDEES